MSKLGELVGRPLFERRGRGQVLTRAGETLVEHAREILVASERAVAALLEERLEGPVRFGAAQDLADVVLPPVLAGFAKQYPGITLHVQVADAAAFGALQPSHPIGSTQEIHSQIVLACHFDYRRDHTVGMRLECR